MQGVKIAEDGDNLKFEREGPFGTYKWSKKKPILRTKRRPLGSAKNKSASSPSKNAAAKQDR